MTVASSNAATPRWRSARNRRRAAAPVDASTIPILRSRAHLDLRRKAIGGLAVPSECRAAAGGEGPVRGNHRIDEALLRLGVAAHQHRKIFARLRPPKAPPNGGFGRAG